MVDWAQLIKLVIGVSVLLLVFSLGMRTTLADAVSFFQDAFRPPRQLLKAILVMNVVVPALAILAVALTSLPQAVEVALISIAVSPVPPVLPGKQMKFGAQPRYVFGLLVAASITSVFLTPLTVEIAGRVFHREAHIGMFDIARLVGKTVLGPIAAGVLVRHLAPSLADRMAPFVSRVAFALLILGCLPVLYTSWPGIASLLGNGTALVVTAVVVAAVAAGHLIGGPNEGNRTALAITSAMRHPGIAMIIATTNFADNKLLPAAIMLYVLIATIVTTIYGKLRYRSMSAAVASSSA